MKGEDLSINSNKGKSWVYHKDGPAKIVTDEEAAALIKLGEWADTPAKWKEVKKPKAANA